MFLPITKDTHYHNNADRRGNEAHGTNQHGSIPASLGCHINQGQNTTVVEMAIVPVTSGCTVASDHVNT